MALYPPILSSTQLAMPSNEWKGSSDLPFHYVDSNGYAEIFFTMPMYNDPEIVRKGHCELSIRYKNSGDTVINSDYSPNGTVYFFNGQNSLEKHSRAYLELIDEESKDRIWKLCFKPDIIVKDRLTGQVGLLADEEYNVQIRFGEDAIKGGVEDFYHIDDTTSNFDEFATWWNDQVDEQLIGEWSNTVVIYSFGLFQADYTNSDQAYKDFIPQGIFEYRSKYDDAPVRAELTYTYSNGDGQQLRKRIELSSSIVGKNLIDKQTQEKNKEQGITSWNVWNLNWNLGVFPYYANDPDIHLEFTITTEHGVVVGVTGGEDLTGYLEYYQRTWDNDTNYYLAGGITDHKLIGEEIDDGLIAKDIYLPDGAAVYGEEIFFKIFRVNVETAEAIEMNTNIAFSPTTAWTQVTFKDYVVEHGEKFIYFTVRYRKNNNGVYMAEKLLYGVKEMIPDAKTYFELSPEVAKEFGFDDITDIPLNYLGRLTDMQYSFLTTREHQLRLSGNMTLNSISWNTQDALQTTIGSKYPFYTRNSATKYRTMQIGALISVQLDPTATFLELDMDKKLYLWRDGYNRTRQNEYDTNEVVLDSDDILMTKEVNRSRHRIGEPKKSKIESLETRMYQVTEERDHTQVTEWRPYTDYKDFYFNQFGPYTEFSPKLDEIQSREYTSERTPDMILLERKYREKVMEWLTNGRPKLFRSPTEGNIIVVLSAISFTPFQNSDRMVYSFTATATEVAEYNLDNLIDYNLIPAIFTTAPIADDDLGYKFHEGEDDPIIKQLEKEKPVSGGVANYGRKLFR